MSLLVDDNENYTNVQWTTPISELIRDDFVLADDYLTRHVTLQDALSHRTGMPRHDISYGQDGTTTRDMVRSLRYLPLTKPLRTTFQYCNIMVGTVGYVMEQLTGKRLAEVFMERIWKPLNMTSTFLHLETALKSRKPLATAYRWSDSAKDFQAVPYPNQTSGEGDGSMISNVLDYSKWVRMMMTRAPPLSPAAHQALVTPQMIMDTDTVGFSSPALYGQGWMLQTYRGVDVVFHGGAVNGFGAEVFYIPSKCWGIVMAANTATTSNMVIDILLWQLVDDLLDVPTNERVDRNAQHEEDMDRIRQMRNTTLARQLFYPSGSTAHLPQSLPLEDYAGSYWHPAYKELLLKYRNGTLEAKVRHSSLDFEVTIYHVTGEFFFCIGYPAWSPEETLYAPAEFKINAGGEVVGFGVLFEPAMSPDKIWFTRVRS
ncbi:hypothetical protein MMC18_000489 [Xylographa bjoerkii]|nr:hypothetical protein [Xylographa bjoerkii]